MSANPVDKLELQALLQRDQVHETIGELKEKVDAARAKLDVRLTPASICWAPP